MKLGIAEHAGYCAGVRRAAGLLEDALKQGGGPVCTPAPLVHNERVTAAFESRGTVNLGGDPAAAPPGAVIVLPSHGVAPSLLDALSKRASRIVDATCPCVHAARAKLETARGQKRRIIVAGDPAHAEVRALPGFEDGEVAVVSTPQQARPLAHTGAPSFLMAQTTFAPGVFAEIERTLSRGLRDLDVYDSICRHTHRAQDAARALAARCDVMIVIGGRRSANTRRLCEVCRAAGARVRRIESPSELRPGRFQPDDRVGVTAGASTPPAHIREVVDWFRARFEITGAP